MSQYRRKKVPKSVQSYIGSALKKKARSVAKYVPYGALGMPLAVGAGMQMAKKAMGTLTKTKKKNRYQRKEQPDSIYRGAVKLRKKKFDDSYNLYGVVYRREQSGVIDSTQCQYLGHSTVAPRILLDNMCRCIVKELLRQMGRPVHTWDETFGITSANQWKLAYQYFTISSLNSFSSDENPELTFRTINITTTQSFDTIAQNLATDIHGAFASLEHHEFFRFYIIEDQAGVAIRDNVATIHANQFTVTVGGNSYLKFQNTTQARVVEAVEDDPDDSKDNIRGNPLSCRMYHNNKQNGFTYLYRRAGLPLTTRFGFVAGDSTGIIQYDSTDTTNITSLHKAPSHNAFNHRTATKGNFSGKDFIINPGEIKTSYLTYEKQYKFNTLIKILENTLNNTQNYILPIGNAKMIAFEHTLKVLGDPNVSVSFQHDLTMKMKYLYKPRIKSDQIVDII